MSSGLFKYKVTCKLFPYKSYIYLYISIYIYWPTIVESNIKASFSITITQQCWGGCYSFPWITPLQGQTAILTPLLLLTIAASWLGLLNWGSLRSTALSLQADPHSGLPISNWLNCRQHLPILFPNAHLLPLLLPLIYAGASLIDSSVKGQYTTKEEIVSRSLVSIHVILVAWLDFFQSCYRSFIFSF